MERKWKITGIVSTAIIVAVFPLQFFKFSLQHAEDGDVFPVFTGTASCLECHQVEYNLWEGSDHDLAMDHATEETVLGDFEDASFESEGLIHKFYKKDDKFYVYTHGPGGEPGEFQISYTFGVKPLQQYLVELDKGRLQCLPLAWDTQKKEWYHLVPAVYANEEITPDDWLYWTNNGQNWNGMCADCHSTQLKKNFDPETKHYNTTWSDIDVGCEACHGPGSAHIEWARLPEGDRPVDVNTGLTVMTSNISSREYVDNCARCHARRSALRDYDNRSNEFLDYFMPQVAVSPVYFADGQILEENYVYGSFLQSKMFMKDVRCGDCHNSHSLEFINEGNSLCLQCHRADIYDTYSHHFHKKTGREHEPQLFNSPPLYEEGEGARCINCHMDGRYYMGVDYRRDHSFRIPRPDLTIDLGVPNACNSCHKDEDPQWAQSYIEEWYGISRAPHYGSLFAQGAEADQKELAAIVFDELRPPMVRATATAILENDTSFSARQTLKSTLGNTDPLLRAYAARSYNATSLPDLKETFFPLLHDPVKPVRMEAAMKLSQAYAEIRDTIHKKALEKCIEEYEEAMLYTGDFAASRHNLGNLYTNLGDIRQAEKEYRQALAIDNKFYPSQVNLANLLNRQGRNDEAEKLLTEVLKDNPDLEGINYSLGLLYAEMEKYDEALLFLEKATGEKPVNPRAYYNYGLLLNQLGETGKAEEALLDAFSLEPDNPRFVYALSTFYAQREDKGKALEYGRMLLELLPADESVRNYVNSLERENY